jgi:hypothetical protein
MPENKKVSIDEITIALQKKWREMYEEKARNDEWVWISKNGKPTRVKAKDCL